MASFTIKLKDTSIAFNDIIDLTDEQIALILSQAEKKTEAEWLDPETKGIKIALSPEQKAAVVEHKNRLVHGHTAATLTANRKVRFMPHFSARVALRIDDGAPFARQKSLAGMLDLVINSNALGKNAEWKGYGGLNYNFAGEYEGKACKVSVAFDGKMLLITVITEGPSRATTSVGKLISEEQLARIRGMAVESEPRKKQNKHRR